MENTQPNQKPDKPGADENAWASFGLYGAVGFQLAFSVIAGLYLGYWADQRWGTTPWLLLLGLLLGSAAGFYNLIKLLDWKQKRS